MKKILFVLTLFVCFQGYAQNQAANWYFGQGAGINFDLASGAVTSVDGGQLNTREGCTSISNDSGELVLYTDGSIVFNRDHQIMLNGTGLFGDSSSTQSAIVVPAPKDPNIYYIFTVDTSIHAADPDNGFNYSVVDMTLDGGLGGVTIKNSPLLENSTEKITAVLKDCNTESIWVITFASVDGLTRAFTSYHAFEVSEFGVNTTSVVSTFPPLLTDFRGQIKVSPDGTKLISANFSSGLFLFDFDPATGVVSNLQELFINSASTFAYGVEFSPNSELLYVHSSNNASNSSLTQFNLKAADIQASEFRVDQRQLYRGSLQLGPNGKIYRALSDIYGWGLPNLGVINNPNVIGAACNYQHNGINLFPNLSTQGLPPFIQSFFNGQIDIIQNNISTIELSLCDGDTYTLMYDDIPDAVYTWYKDDVLLPESDFDLIITEGGTYKLLIVFNNGDCQTFEGIAHVDFFEVPIANPVTDYVLCSDTDFTVFDLTTKDTEVLGAQAVPILISYHLSEQDAINNVPIVNPGNYTNTSNPQTIYVRSQFDDNGNGMADVDECYITDMTFDLVVNHNPIIFPPDDIRICSDQVSMLYDLTIRESQITGGDTTIALAYYESQLDLDNGNPIVDPSQYINTILDRDILVLPTGTNLCTSTVTLSLKTILYANLNRAPTTIEECEIDNDGFDFFDITRRETEILNGLGPADFTFTYYEDEADAIAGNSATITNTANFENTQVITQTIYVRVLPVTNECFIVVPLTLIVNPVPEKIEIEDRYVICLDNGHGVVRPITQTFLPNPPIDTQLNEIEYTFQWYSGAEIEVNTDPNSVIITGATGPAYSPMAAGDYTVIATNIATGCRIPASTLVVGSYPPESISVELISTAFSSNNIIEVTVVGIGEYEYRLDFGPWQSGTRFENVTGGEHVVYVRDLLNCNELSEIQIVIDYPKYFTPNGDGYHDTWNIKGIAAQPSSKIYIFDRYGKLLKELSPLGTGWDGTFNGNRLPSSDYWFTVEYFEPSDGTLKQFKAHFSLKR